MNLEFELPLVACIFIIMLNIVYFSKKNINLIENKLYEVILVSAFVFSVLDTILHFNGSMNSYEELINNYYMFANILNKIIVGLFNIIFSSLFSYIMLISYKKLKINPQKIFIPVLIINLFCFIVLMFTNIEILRIGNVTNVAGSTTIFGYMSVAFWLLSSLIVSIINMKKFDKRYLAIFLILPIMVLFYVFTLIFPGIIIYDVILSLLCYIMYFTIENPDLKIIEQLNLAKDQAEKANLAKSDFLSSMSHEIRTPLNAIVGFSQCILEEDTLEAAKEDAKDIVTASQNLLEIVNGILDISKIEADKMEIVEANYSPLDDFESLAKLMIPRIGDKPIELKIKFAKDLPATLYGDSGKVKQIITNILTNAVKYTDKGEINFVVNCVNNENECSLVISVEDTGRGIKPDKINKLFTKFDRLEEDRNTTTEGTGLGLAITKRLVEMLGGKIVVQSKYGEGSKFTVYLRQKIISLSQTILNTKIEEFSSNNDFSNKKVLIVDDNKINIKVAERLLRDYNLNIESVESGFECLDKINNGNTYDLILLDDMMPKMSGVETLKELKKIGEFNTPCIALTANAVSGMREKYLSNGFDDYLSKPIDKNELKRILEYYLGKESDSLFGPLPKEIYEIDDNSIEQTHIDDKEKYYHNQNYLINNSIDVDKGLEFLEDIQLYNDTFDNFIIEASDRIKELDKYQKEKDMANYAILVHATKSDAKYLGCSKLADIAYTHEIKSKENDYIYIQSNYKELIDEINRVIEIGKNYLNRS